MEQKNIPWLGALVDALYVSLPILSFVNFLAILTVLYTNIHPYLQEYLPWLRFWVFLIIVGILATVLAILVYKFVVPSLWTYRSKQMFTHESEITNKLNQLIGKVNGREKKNKSTNKTIIAVSGGFDPIHPGHIDYIEGALKLGDYLLVILTRDEQLIEKDRIAGNIKNRAPILYEVRKTVLEWGLAGRGEVVMNIDKDITCCISIRKYHPDIFAKGGTSWDVDNLPEKSVCDELGIEIVFGVGGYDKPYSSSKLGVGGKC